MNAEGLLVHYTRIADAPDAITRLRRFVLDLAIRGKLVAQDRHDEPASVLLRKIDVEKSQLAKQGQIQQGKVPSSCAFGESPYGNPGGWEWVTISAVVNSHVGGGTPSKSNASYWDGGIYWASVKDVGKSKYLDQTIDTISEAGLANSSSNLVSPGHLIVVTRMGLGKVSINRVPIAINQDLRALALSNLVSTDYCYLFFLTHGFEGSGLTVKGIKVEQLLSTPFPLPPLAEQHRIVAKVDELMALCDQLEAARAQREATRDRLAAASLARLNTPDRDTFPADARFALDALPALTTRPDQVKQLRQTILNLAVRGKLVHQATNEGTGNKLISELAAARCSTELPERMSKRRISQGAISNDEKYFHAPSSWGWARLVEIGKTQTGTSPSSSDPSLFGNYIPFIKPSDLDSNEIWYEGPGLSQAGVLRSRLADKGSVLMVCIGATLGKVNTANRPICFNQQINSVTPYIAGMSSYVALALKASDFQALAWSNAGTGTLPIISKGKWELLPIPLPPLSEQNRIVAKVGELMTLCDQLEASLSIGEATRSRLLDSLLHEALAPVATQSSEHPRAAISSYVISRLSAKRNFGRTAHMKYLFLAEARLGLNLGGRYMREAAGPLDAGIYELEKQAEAAGWYTHSVETLGSGNEKVSYKPGKALNAMVEEGITVLGPLRDEMDRLIDLMGGLKTEQVEIIATLFAAWNDALLDGHTPDDDWIVKEVREHWHVSKQRFAPADLHKSLGWMRQNDVIPLGHPPRTMQQTTMEL